MPPELLPNLPETALFLFGLHCLIGAIAALIAQQKGHRLGAALAIGLVGGSLALLWALRLPPSTATPK